jgi:hypothetical protein
MVVYAPINLLTLPERLGYTRQVKQRQASPHFASPMRNLLLSRISLPCKPEYKMIGRTGPTGLAELALDREGCCCGKDIMAS